MDICIEGAEIILLVEDNPGDIRLIEEAFKASPLDPTIHTTKTREDALNYLSQRDESEDVPNPDLVLLDWKLSQHTGEEIVQTAKSVEPAIPVVVLTSSKAAPQTRESSDPRADKYIEKQTEPGGYIEILRSCGTE